MIYFDEKINNRITQIYSKPRLCQLTKIHTRNIMCHNKLYRGEQFQTIRVFIHSYLDREFSHLNSYNILIIIYIGKKVWTSHFRKQQFRPVQIEYGK